MVNIMTTGMESSDKTTLAWRDLTVWTDESQPWYRYRSRQHCSRNYILDQVDGEMTDGAFLAVIGPSGAGKTTFLVSLAGKCNLPQHGAVTVNGTPIRNLDRGFIELVPQFDVFIDTLTVLEHLNFMTEMKLSRTSSTDTKWYKLNALMKQLKLHNCVDSSISALSGGEKKLLSLATAMLSNPKIIFCDEPTTGLDSYNAALVINVLKGLASKGNIVACSVHQPSSDVFHQFGSVILIAEAKLLFYGTQHDCRELFESVNLICPNAYNPAEFYLTKISRNDHDKVINYAEIIHNAYKNSYQKPFMDDKIIASMIDQEYKITRPNWFKQVILLTRRSSLSLKREVSLHLLQLFLHLVSALILCVVYSGLRASSQQNVQNMRGLLWLITSEISFGVTYASLGVFGFDLALFKREADVYSSSAYYVSRFLCMLPRCFIWPFLFLIITTSGVSLPAYSTTIWEMTLSLTVLAITSASYGVGMAALFTSTGIIGDIIPCVDLVLFLSSGAFVRLSTFPFWAQCLRYLSHFYYGLEAISNVYWQQIDNIDCTGNITNCVKDGAQVLIEDDYRTDFYLQDSVGLLSLALVWNLIGYFGLRREGNTGYAY